MLNSYHKSEPKSPVIVKAAGKEHWFFLLEDSEGDKSRTLYHRYPYKDYWKEEKVVELQGEYYMSCYNHEIYILYCKDEARGIYRILKYSHKKVWEIFERNLLLKDVHSISFFISPKGLGFILFSKEKEEGRTQGLYKDFNYSYFPWCYENFFNQRDGFSADIVIEQRQFVYEEALYGMLSREELSRPLTDKENNSQKPYKSILMDISSYYEEVIYNLQEKIEQVNEEKNQRIRTLLKVIEEKEKIIDRLYNLIKLKR
ncbi:hypothetical protein ACPWSR_08370 [Alloiococcus sp. CFN-8]|uniref:hypothetical protein n=1 Tax=Alloiococcus sp. CFN-8 TaxID=3416081 RepID=UPI003CFAF3A1